MDWTMNLCFDLSTDERSAEGCSITANSAINRVCMYRAHIYIYSGSLSKFPTEIINFGILLYSQTHDLTLD